MPAKRTTLKDVARAAGVSAMSVSKALNNKGGISAETQKHILNVARQLKYHPNMVAKSLRLDETKTLGVVVSDSSEMVTAEVLRGIADGAQHAGYNILIINTDGVSSKERNAIEVFIDKCVDGILMIAPTITTREDTVWLHSLDIRMAFLMREGRHASVDSVINDNLSGGYDVVSSLLRRGCRSLRFLSLTYVSQIGGTRLEGARMAMAEYGLTLEPETIRYCRPQIQEAEEAMRSWISEEGTEYDAVVCGCDIIAIGVMNALLDNGIEIPRQVCVCGYDDIKLAEYLRVPLTTIHQPLYEIGQKGVEVILERIQFPDNPIKRVVMENFLVERQSTNR